MNYYEINTDVIPDGKNTVSPFLVISEYQWADPQFSNNLFENRNTKYIGMKFKFVDVSFYLGSIPSVDNNLGRFLRERLSGDQGGRINLVHTCTNGIDGNQTISLYAFFVGNFVDSLDRNVFQFSNLQLIS